VTLAFLDLIPPPFPFTAFVLVSGGLEGQRAEVLCLACSGAADSLRRRRPAGVLLRTLDPPPGEFRTGSGNSVDTDRCDFRGVSLLYLSVRQKDTTLFPAPSRSIGIRNRSLSTGL
jgi:hypothetical protein